MSLLEVRVRGTRRAVGMALTAAAVVALSAGPVQASTWTVEATPNVVSGGQYDQNVAYGVDCVSASACMAVGYADANNSSTNQALAMRWDGTAWRLAMPSSDASLYNVSCLSATKCFAAGIGQKTNYREVPVILRWNGRKWSAMTVPLRKNQVDQNVQGIACPTSTSCLAVGGSSNGPGSIFRTLVYHYNGTSWSIVKSPNPSTTTSGGGTFFSDVSCLRASKCFVTGYAGGATFIERWGGGTRWRRQVVPAPAGSDALNAISCASSGCIAIGGANTTSGSYAYALVYDGTSWKLHSFSSTPDSTLRDVSCTKGACISVGTQGSSQSPFVMRFANGKWRAMTVPTAGAASTNYIGVDCWSGSSCRAVGSRSDDTTSYQTFAAVHP